MRRKIRSRGDIGPGIQLREPRANNGTNVIDRHLAERQPQRRLIGRDRFDDGERGASGIAALLTVCS